jgi:hypothetical protein
MKAVKTYYPYLADYGEATMKEHAGGEYVSYRDYIELYKKYIRARATVRKNKIKAALKKMPSQL